MTSLQYGAVKGALLMGAGLFVVRAAMSRSLGDFVLAAGIAGLEIGAVALVTSKAKALDADIEAWRKAQDANTLLQAAVRDLEKRRAKAKGIEETIAAILDKMDIRSRNSDPDRAKSSALAQARAGFSAGVAENRAAGIVPRETV
jgi:hypothetical protein